MIATAVAHPNIALVKYWGKRDALANLPATGSLSMTLDAFPTTTTVALDTGLAVDSVHLNGTESQGEQRARVTRFLDRVRLLAGSDLSARVESVNTVPTAAGLASSAAGFAALAGAAAAAYGLTLDDRALTRLARRGSGSAARSIIGGFAVWHAGDTDEASFAEPVEGPPLAMVIATVDAQRKSVPSRAAMIRTALTSPYYPAWVTSTEQSLDAALEAMAAHDFDRIGRIAETNALRMHALTLASDPPIRYLTASTMTVLERVEQLRADGVSAWTTIDAGSNPVVLCRPESISDVCAALEGTAQLVVAHPGPGMRVLQTKRIDEADARPIKGRQ